MSFIFLFEIIKVAAPEPWIFFWIPASIAEVAVAIPSGAKIFFAKGTATFINRPANLLNNDPKNPPDWTILEIWALESFKSIGNLSLNAFLNLVFYLVVSNNSWGRLFPSNILKFILRVVPVLFLTAVFIFFQLDIC